MVYTSCLAYSSSAESWRKCLPDVGAQSLLEHLIGRLHPLYRCGFLKWNIF